MKTRFLINSEIFELDPNPPAGRPLTYDEKLEEAYKYYEKHYKEDGYIFDKENEDVYIIFDEQFDFKEGDRITISEITRLVIWKDVNITNRIITYYLEEE